ncbi:MAG: BlaI/MecI/CopY family transcriptional regulator [Actinomycetota bacterium]|nr:BlaI/MecI/CopY family transcriptional regulator [Actinomycetota bacterium]
MKRRRFSKDFKLKVLDEIAREKPLVQATRDHNITESMICKWCRQYGSASQSQSNNDGYALAYTTIMTVMSRLANKGILKQERRTPAFTPAFIYTPNVSKEEIAAYMIGRVVDKVLEGNTAYALSLMLESGNIKGSDMQKIKKALTK